MDSIQIEKILNSLPETYPLFSGVYTNSYIPSSFQEQCNGFIIVNTLNAVESNVEAIGHWVAIIMRDGVMLFFDSYGLHPSLYGNEIHRVYTSHSGNKMVVFHEALQASDSYTCGGYVIYFCHMISLNKSLYELRGKFTKDKNSNDKFVRRFIMRLTGTSLECNREFCPAYMFMTDCSKYCACNK